MTNKDHLRTQFLPLVPSIDSATLDTDAHFVQNGQPAAHKFTATLSSYVKVAQT